MDSSIRQGIVESVEGDSVCESSTSSLVVHHADRRGCMFRLLGQSVVAASTSPADGCGVVSS